MGDSHPLLRKGWGTHSHNQSKRPANSRSQKRMLWHFNCPTCLVFSGDQLEAAACQRSGRSSASWVMGMPQPSNGQSWGESLHGSFSIWLRRTSSPVRTAPGWRFWRTQEPRSNSGPSCVPVGCSRGGPVLTVLGARPAFLRDRPIGSSGRLRIGSSGSRSVRRSRQDTAGRAPARAEARTGWPASAQGSSTAVRSV